ncbi:hypothetical protein Droror1_Dr00005503 [Drosera rotundifolia]
MIQISTRLDFPTKIIQLINQHHHQEAFSFTKLLLNSSFFTHQSLVPILPSLIKASHLSNSRHVGTQLHCYSIKHAIGSDVVVSSSLISMYAKFSDIIDARKVFDEMSARDDVAWNTMIMGEIGNGRFDEALGLFRGMWVDRYVLKPEVVASVVRVCCMVGEVRMGREIHGLSVVLGMVSQSEFLGTAMVDFYMKCGNPRSAFCVLEEMRVRSEVPWTAMIDGCAANEEYGMAVDCFRAMQAEGVTGNRVTLISLIPACAKLGMTKHVKEIHGHAFRLCFESELSFSSAIVHAYSQFQETSSSAIMITERSLQRDIVMWGSIIGGFSRCGNLVEAMRHFNRMQSEGTKPNHVIVLEMLSGSASEPDISIGEGIHCYALISGLFSNHSVRNATINMYAKCGFLPNSRQIFEELEFRDIFSWNSLINAYGISGRGSEALQLFHKMKESGVEADSVALLSALSACVHAGLVKEGQRIFVEAVHGRTISLGVEHYACQINLLGRAGKLEEACNLVRQMPMEPNGNVWSSLVSACKEHRRLDVAERLASQLVKQEPDNAANYALLGMVFAESEDWVGVEEVRRVMRTKGLKKHQALSKIVLENV